MDPDPIVETDGSEWWIWYYECSDSSTFTRLRCIANCPAGAIDPIVADPTVAEVRERVIAMVDPPLPRLRHTFDSGDFRGNVRAIVNAETWWWSDGDAAPIVVGDADGGTWVSLTATPDDLVVDPGDGSADQSCPFPGVAYDHSVEYDDQVPGADRGACVHVYEARAGSIAATASVTWELSWTGFSVAEGFLSGTLTPLVRTETVTFPVWEIQSVITE